MPNIKTFKPLTNPEWISIEFEDGTISNPIHDPTQEYRAEVDQIAKKVAGIAPDPMASATASLGGDLVGGAGAAVSKTDVPTPVAGISDFKITEPPAAPASSAADGSGNVGRILGKYALKPQEESGMPAGGAAPAQPSAPQPDQRPQPPTGAPGPMQVTGTTSTWQRQKGTQSSSSGIAEADLPKVQEAQDASFKASEEANEANYAAKANQLWDEWGRYSEDAKKRIAEKSVAEEQERAFDQKVQSAYQKYDQDAARPIDPSKAFAGEKRWYAFMAGFGDVLRNVGAALAGQRAVADPGATLDAMVDREVNLQMAQKEQDLKAGRLSIDRFTADRETARHKVGVAISQLAQAELGKAQTKQAYAALGALKKGADATVADARAKGAQALARQETKSESDTQVSGGSTERGLVPVGGVNPELALKQAQVKQAQLEEMDSDEVARIISVPDEDGKQRPVSVKRAKAAVDGASDLAVKLPRADVAEQQLENVLKELGVPAGAYNRDTGTIDWSKAGDLKGAGAVDSRTWLKEGPIGAVASGTGLQYSDPDKVTDASAALQESITFMTTGATATKQQQETFRKQAAADLRNEQAVKDNLSRTASQIATQRKSMLSGNPDATRLYEHNRKNGNVSGAPSLKPGVN